MGALLYECRLGCGEAHDLGRVFNALHADRDPGAMRLIPGSAEVVNGDDLVAELGIDLRYGAALRASPDCAHVPTSRRRCGVLPIPYSNRRATADRSLYQ